MSRIVGYVDPLVASPGDRVAVKVSCGRESYQSKLLRLGPGLDQPEAPPVRHAAVEGVLESKHQGRLQYTRPGSFARLESWRTHNFDEVDHVVISFWCQPTLPDGAGHEQYLFSTVDVNSSSGFACLIDKEGTLGVTVGSAQGLREIQFPIKLWRNRWYHLRVQFDPHSARVGIRANVKGRDLGESSIVLDHWKTVDQSLRLSSDSALTVASNTLDSHATSSPVKSASFNGKIDTFKVEVSSRDENTVALDLDFSKDIQTDEIVDASANGCHGHLVNAPARAVTGHDWDAGQVDWTLASSGYGAIHFHDDDVDDALWDTDFELQLPEAIRSGCYGVLVDDGQSSDIISLFVRPSPSASTPPVAVIMPTFTYAGRRFER